MLTDLDNKLSEYGLLNRGGFILEKNELAEFFEINSDAQSLIMVGVAGSAFWSRFQKSKEYMSYLQGEIDPLDRWSKRIGDQIAKSFSGQAVYPFEGPPYYPFIQWAKRCETLHSSKMGFSIHPEFGLWHAFRFALLLPNTLLSALADTHEKLDQQSQAKAPSLCSTCVDSPCLSHCPVNAYTESGFDPDKCFNHLKQNKKGECRTQGCIARRSCPEGINYRYVPEHAEFHMTAFYQSQKERSEN